MGKYSTFDDTPKNLMVIGDEKSGTIVLCHEEHYLSTNKQSNGGQRVTKYIVSLIPRVALIPSISQDSGPLLSSTLVRSPAPHILVSIDY